MNQFGTNRDSDQQESEIFSPNLEKDDLRIQEAPTIDESSELERDAPELLPCSTAWLSGSSEVWQIDHTAMDILLVTSLDV